MYATRGPHINATSQLVTAHALVCHVCLQQRITHTPSSITRMKISITERLDKHLLVVESG